MSEGEGPLELDRELRRELETRLAERPWPPPPESEHDELLARTAGRVLHDLADEPPEGFPECATWILVVPDENAAALRSQLLDSRLLVAGQTGWTRLGPDSQESIRAAAALLTLELAGESPASWAALLPPGAPSPDELLDSLGEDAPAVTARLSAPGFGELLLLHAWTVGPEGATHVPELSGVLHIRPLA